MKKKIIAVLCSIIMVIPLVLSNPKAAGSTYNGYGTFSKGSYNYSFSVIIEQTEIGINLGSEGVGLNIPWASGSSFSINFQFNDTYSGIVQFTLNSNTGAGYRLADCLWAADGGYFVSSELPSLTTTSTSKTFKIHVYNSKNVSFTIVTSTVNSFHPTSTQFTGFGVSSFYIDLTDSPDIVDASNYLKDIDLYIPGMSTNLSNIASNTSTIASDIAILKSYLDGLEGYVDNIEPLLQDLQFQAHLNQFDFPNYQHSALYWGYAQVRGTAIHPNLEFWRGLPVFYLLMSEVNNSEYTVARAIRVPGNSSVVLYISSNRLFDSSLFNVYKSGNADIDIEYAANYSTVYQNIYNIITITNNSTGVNYVELEPTANMYIMPYYIGSPLNVPDEVKSLFGFEYDNTYTRLLQSINTGISTLNGDYDTSQYDQYEQTIDNLNDNMRDRFNSSETSFQNNLNNILTPDQTSGGSNTIFEQFHFDVINGVFTDFLGQLFNAAPVLQYLLLFGLLLLVLGVFI